VRRSFARFDRWLRRGSRTSGAEANRLLAKWVVLGLAIGIVAGVGAFLFLLVFLAALLAYSVTQAFS